MNILTQLFQIILLKRQPEDIDHNQSFALIFLVTAIGLTYVVNSVSGFYSQPLGYGIVQNLAQAGLLYLALSLAKKQNRFIQTCTALFGISSIMLLFAVIVQAVPALALIGVMLNGWVIYLSIKIIRAAFNINILSAIFLTISISLFSVIAVSVVYPEFITETQAIITQQAQAENPQQ